MFEKLIAKFAGKWLAKKTNLQEGTMGTKKWYTSKTIWSDVATVAISIVGLVDVHFTGGKIATNPIYQTVLALLGGMGIYTRVNATTTLTK